MVKTGKVPATFEEHCTLQTRSTMKCCHALSSFINGRNQALLKPKKIVAKDADIRFCYFSNIIDFRSDISVYL